MSGTSNEEAVEAELVADDPAGSQRPNLPWVTWLVSAACIAVYLVLSGKPRKPVDELGEFLIDLGLLRADPVWEGNFWLPFSAVFVHVALWHLAFNVYWLFSLGGALERRIGAKFFALFLLAAAVVTSGFQFAFTEATGIGATGVVYAIFGYLWVARKQVPEFRAILGKSDIAIFIVWLIGCVVATRMKLWGAWEIGNAAHISGLAFGVFAAAVFNLEYRVALFGSLQIALLTVSVVPLFWNPLSLRWVSRRAHEAHMNKDFATAMTYYNRSLELGQDSLWVQSCLAMLYYDMGDMIRYNLTLELVRSFDPLGAEKIERYASARKAEKSGAAPVEAPPRPEQREPERPAPSGPENNPEPPKDDAGQARPDGAPAPAKPPEPSPAKPEPKAETPAKADPAPAKAEPAPAEAK